jgi:hypothetical protein
VELCRHGTLRLFFLVSCCTCRQMGQFAILCIFPYRYSSDLRSM